MCGLSVMRDDRERLERLMESLGEALAEYRKPMPDFDSDQAAVHPQREGCAKALTAVMQYLRPLVPEHGYLHPLLSLLGAIADADEGRSPKLFKPRRDPKGSRIPIGDDAKLAMASAIVTTMIHHGTAQRNAVRAVARKIGCEQTYLRRWRDNLAERPEHIRKLYQREVDAERDPALMLDALSGMQKLR